MRADARDSKAAPVAALGSLDRAGPLQQSEKVGGQRLAVEGQAPAEDIAQGPGALLAGRAAIRAWVAGVTVMKS